MRLSELAARLNATLLPGLEESADMREVEIHGVAAASLATQFDVVFAENESALAAAFAGKAGAILTTATLSHGEAARPILVVAHPRLAFARAARLLASQPAASYVHPSAIVSTTATIAEHVAIGPLGVVGDRVVIGARTRIDAGVIVGDDVSIGEGCHLYPRVVLYAGVTLGNRVIVHAGAVLGADGFGYVRDAESGEYLQFPQQGRLAIEDDVEIGANTTIDRGALEETCIGRGVKLDNLVHVGHNVAIGRNVVIAAQTGVSGSSSIGDGAIVGGQVGIADHVHVGPGAILGAQAGIPSGKRIQGPGTVFWGTPARPIKDYLKELATLARLTRTKRT